MSLIRDIGAPAILRRRIERGDWIKRSIHQRTSEAGAGQWATTIALACTMFDLDCTVYMVKAT